MLPISLDAALNFVWAVLALAAMGVLGYLDYRRSPRPTYRERWRICAVLLVCLSLFPVVSFSDDLLGYSVFRVSHSGQGKWGSAPAGEQRQTPSSHLIQILETLDHYQVESAAGLTVEFRCDETLRAICFTPVSRAVPCRRGRGPPLG